MEPTAGKRNYKHTRVAATIFFPSLSLTCCPGSWRCVVWQWCGAKFQFDSFVCRRASVCAPHRLQANCDRVRILFLAQGMRSTAIWFCSSACTHTHTHTHKRPSSRMMSDKQLAVVWRDVWAGRWWRWAALRADPAAEHINISAKRAEGSQQTLKRWTTAWSKWRKVSAGRWWQRVRNFNVKKF